MLFVFVLPTIAFVDVVGRKMLFYLGLAGMGSMLVLLGPAFSSGVKSWGFGVLIILLVYVACYSLPDGEHRPVLDRGPPLAVIRRAAGPSRVKGDLGEG